MDSHATMSTDELADFVNFIIQMSPFIVLGVLFVSMLIFVYCIYRDSAHRRLSEERQQHSSSETDETAELVNAPPVPQPAINEDGKLSPTKVSPGTSGTSSASASPVEQSRISNPDNTSGTSSASTSSRIKQSTVNPDNAVRVQQLTTAGSETSDTSSGPISQERQSTIVLKGLRLLFSTTITIRCQSGRAGNVDKGQQTDSPQATSSRPQKELVSESEAPKRSELEKQNSKDKVD